MRRITTHEINECNKAIEIAVTDGKEGAPANTHYSLTFEKIDGKMGTLDIEFQDGPIAEVGTNGITNEALLAILIDRMEHFQKGPYACRENAAVLTKLEKAMYWLNARTAARTARGVEGKHEV